MSAPAEPPPGPWHWTPRAFLLYAGAGAGFLAALVFHTPVPLYVAVPLLLAPIATILPGFARGRAARIDWTVSGAGADVLVAGTVSVDPPVESGQLRAEFRPPAALHPAAAPSVSARPEGLEFLLRYRVDGPTLTRLAPPQLVWQDGLGLRTQALRLDDAPDLEVERYPPELDRIGRLRLRRTTSAPGESRSPVRGAAGEFFGVRAWQPTDSPRQINWRATARAGGALLANDFRLERTGDLIVLLDRRPTDLGAVRNDRLQSAARAAALGIASAFLAERSRVGVGVYGEELTVVPLGRGRVQRYRIAQLLREATGPVRPGPSERLAIAARRYFPPGTLTVFLTSLADEESIVPVVHLRRRGFPTVVLSPSPLAVLDVGGTAPEEVLAARLLRLLRRRRIADAWTEAPIVDWPDFWSLEPFVSYLERPAYSGGRAA